MSKYISPIIKFEEIESADVITVSGGVSISALEGVDSGDSKSAIFNAGFWFKSDD